MFSICMFVCWCCKQVEAAWKLGNWDLLRDLLTQQDSVSSKSWEVGVGKLILAAKDRHVADFSDTMKRLKKVILYFFCFLLFIVYANK